MMTASSEAYESLTITICTNGYTWMAAIIQVYHSGALEAFIIQMSAPRR
jgi:hypothetical protein